MQDSNLALRLGPAEDQPSPPSGRMEIEPQAVPAVLRVRPRPRRPFAFRAIVIRDQGLRLFRCA